MPAKLPDSLKSLVIQQWLQGRPRNDIAAQNGLSTGAVTNIVNEWRQSLGDKAADELRGFATTLKNIGITASECALGFRVATTMSRIGVNEDSIETFALDVYNRCKNTGLSPENISSFIQDLIEFSATNVLPISKISDYLKKKRDEKQSLEQEIKGLDTQISTLKQEKKDCEYARDEALRERNMTISELKWYSSLTAELRKHSIPVDDISEFARLVNNIRQHSGYNVDKVINEFWNLEMLRTSHIALKNDIDSQQKYLDKLKEERSALEVYVNMHHQQISTYNSLKAVGFGLRELTFLYDTVNEIAAENEIPVTKAVTKFLSDVEEQYDKNLGFEVKIQKKRDELNNLRNERAKQRAEMLLNPLIAPTLLKLIQRGLGHQDIIDVVDIIEKYGSTAGASSSGGSAAGSSIDRRLLISDLDKYMGLKSAIENLTEQANTLRRDADSLKNQKQDLERNNQRTFSSCIQLSHTLDFLQGVVFSLRNEITSLGAIYTYMMSLLKLQFHDIGKEQSTHRFNEFAALSRSSNGEDVPIDEIKQDVKKAIENLMNKIDPDDVELSTYLHIAHGALI
jgi:predicted  nucleic acid-binding Zn-ribbon protein